MSDKPAEDEITLREAAKGLPPCGRTDHDDHVACEPIPEADLVLEAMLAASRRGKTVKANA